MPGSRPRWHDEDLDALLERIGAVPVDPHEDDDKLDLDAILRFRRAGTLGEALATLRGSWSRQMLATIGDDALAPRLPAGDLACIDPTLPHDDGRVVAVVSGEQIVARYLIEDDGGRWLATEAGERIPLDDGLTVLGVVVWGRHSLR